VEACEDGAVGSLLLALLTLALTGLHPDTHAGMIAEFPCAVSERLRVLVDGHAARMGLSMRADVCESLGCVS
jgi:hypothetical protein